jgi:hypothetical protein
MRAAALAAIAALSQLLHATAAAPGHYSNSTDPVPATTYAECQRKTYNPLAGCPPRTIYVSQSSSRADFTTIQDAIASLPADNSSHVILVYDYP